ncbi:MAG: SOS response-associated peptidase [Hylemonella sp.]|nr:SOS response-associated peptidase [Hylemonella sp.]
MCSHYEAPRNPERYREAFGVQPPAELGKHDVWPSYMAGFIRRHPHAGVGDDAVPEREALLGMFGMVPHWAKDAAVGRRTYNARSETVAEKPSFRDAWRRTQHCIVPAEAIYEPDWRSGRARPTRISRADGQPMGIAGLWTTWRAPTGEIVPSFTMLTINADDHPLMNQFHKPGEEKRMVVILNEDSYDAWLAVGATHTREFLLQYPAELMRADTAQHVQS